MTSSFDTTMLFEEFNINQETLTNLDETQKEILKGTKDQIYEAIGYVDSDQLFVDQKKILKQKLMTIFLMQSQEFRQKVKPPTDAEIMAYRRWKKDMCD